MTRITTTVLVLVLLLNGTTTAMEASGFNDSIGVTLSPGVSSAMDQIVEDARDGFTASEGLGDTLFGLYSAALGTFKLLIAGVFAVPDMLMNFGFPSWIVIPFFAPMYVVATLEFVFIATGRESV